VSAATLWPSALSPLDSCQPTPVSGTHHHHFLSVCRSTLSLFHSLFIFSDLSIFTQHLTLAGHPSFPRNCHVVYRLAFDTLPLLLVTVRGHLAAPSQFTRNRTHSVLFHSPPDVPRITLESYLDMKNHPVTRNLSLETVFRNVPCRMKGQGLFVSPQWQWRRPPRLAKNSICVYLLDQITC
jgi:hypothetical protein